MKDQKKGIVFEGRIYLILDRMKRKSMKKIKKNHYKSLIALKLGGIMKNYLVRHKTCDLDGVNHAQ
jgi:hypothetical protein